jgi:DNA-binding NtrC family response regulator
MATPIDILLVDDEEEFAESLGARLEVRGHRVRVALGGASALDLLDEQEPDVLLLDVLMPGVDGISVLKEVKRRAPLVEVILLTGHATVDMAVTGLKAGAFDFVEKPAKFDELLHKLEAARCRRVEHEEKIIRAESIRLTRRTGDI